MSQQFSSENSIVLSSHTNLFVKQIRELAEFFGFETRNKYQIMDEHGQPIAYAAEQQKGFLGWIARQFLGHWRTFDILIFNVQRQPVLVARHPFRFLFQRLEIYAGDVLLGAVQQRWAIFRKRFDIEDSNREIIMQVSSPFFRFWTFPFTRGGREVGRVEKKWGGFFTEIFSDKDTFHVGFDPNLSENERRLILAASLFIDLQYFEAKGGHIDILGG